VGEWVWDLATARGGAGIRKAAVGHSKGDTYPGPCVHLQQAPGRGAALYPDSHNYLSKKGTRKEAPGGPWHRAPPNHPKDAPMATKTQNLRFGRQEFDRRNRIKILYEVLALTFGGGISKQSRFLFFK
jgi:hypothetical protein